MCEWLNWEWVTLPLSVGNFGTAQGKSFSILQTTKKLVIIACFCPHRLPRRWTGWFAWQVSWRQTLWPWREWRSTQKHRPRSVRFLRKNLFSWKNSSHLTELQTSCQLECEILSILGAREMNYVDDKSWFVNKYPTIVEPQSSVKYYITNFIRGGGERWGFKHHRYRYGFISCMRKPICPDCCSCHSFLSYSNYWLGTVLQSLCSTSIHAPLG